MDFIFLQAEKTQKIKSMFFELLRIFRNTGTFFQRFSAFWHKGRSTHDTALIQSVLHFPDLGECFTYSKRMLTTYRKVSTGFWSQSLRQKLTQNDRIFWSLEKLQRQNVWILAKTLTSEARGRFSVCRTHKFWVCKIFYWITDWVI